MPARHSINKDRERGWLAQKAKRFAEGFGIIALRMRRLHRVQHHLAQAGLGRGVVYLIIWRISITLFGVLS
jgi:hypothetical protein